MPIGSTLTSFDAFLMEEYDDENVEWLTCKDRPFSARLKKTEGGGGSHWVVPVGYANPQGHGGDLASAQAGAQQASGGNLQGVKWVIPWGEYNDNVVIGDKVIKASRGNMQAFFEDEAAEIDRLYEGFADTMANYLLGDQGHTLTPGTFTISSGVCTLVQPDDIVNIEVGAILVASANPGTQTTDTLLGGPSLGYVISVNRNAGTFTVSTSSGGSAATPASWTGSMYAFRQGDFGGSSTPNVILTGVGGWVPSADPTSTAFMNVDRTKDIQRLSGVRLTAAEIAGLGIEQRLKKLCTRMTGRGMGPGPTDIFLNPEKWQALADSLESRGIRTLDGKIGVFNFEKVRLAAGGKMVDVWADRFVPINVAYALNMDTIELKTFDGFPAVMNGDGLNMLRLANANAYEHRLVSYPAFVIRAPGYCGRTAV